MKISRAWLQSHFEKDLPSAETLSDALTFHAFEIDGIEEHGSDHILDVKVTPNRGHDCLCHRGIAKELSAIFEMPMKSDALKHEALLEPKDAKVQVKISEPSLCLRYTAAHIRNVTVAPSPEWLKTALESIGQRSINNVVDATNYVMFNLGQPLHAFDGGKLSFQDNSFAIEVRKARAGEKITALDHKEYALTDSMLVIADAHADVPVGIAGVKGGLPAGVDETTKEIVIESANFDGVSTRKTAAALKLRTDASSRFEQVISPELAAHGMKAVVELIMQLAGGELVGFADVYPSAQVISKVSVSASKVNAVLGTSIPQADMERALTRLDLSHMVQGETLTVTPRFERLDLNIQEDLIEEIGRIIGYDLVPTVELPMLSEKPAVNANFSKIEFARAHMAEHGYNEVYTSVFADKGERQVLNKVGGERPYLRANLTDGLKDALERNVRNKDLLGLKQVKLIEIGTVWSKNGEEMRCATAEEKGEIKEFAMTDIPDAPENFDFPRTTIDRYKIFSKYPFIVRDIAMWVPTGTDAQSVIATISQTAGPLLARAGLFDTFVKGEKTSLAFRIVFQSFEKTLTDEDANAAMATVTDVLKQKGYEIR